ncbi:hypothetical protein ACWDUL_21235 [Nocardia niigatensis]
MWVEVGFDTHSGAPESAPTTTIVDDDAVPRAIVAGRDGSGPAAVEHFFVVAPAIVHDKATDADFDADFARATGAEMSLFPADGLTAATVGGQGRTGMVATTLAQPRPPGPDIVVAGTGFAR